MQQQPMSFEAKAEKAFSEMKTFLILWVGQLVSGLGSGLTAFAIPVWVYQKTGSAEQFGLLAVAAAVPALLISPFAGALVDRWDRKTVMIWGDVGAALMTLAIAYLFFTDSFQVWHLFIIVVFGSTLGAFQEPAFGAAITMLVPREHFTRAGGLMQTGGAVVSMITPLAAASLMGIIGIPGILMIDFATFLVAMATMLAIKIPNPPRMPQPEGQRPSLFREAMYGWHFIVGRKALLALLIFFACINFGMGIVNTLLSPMVLSFTSVQAVGVVGFFTGLATFLGGVLMGTWGGPKRRIHGVLGGGVLVALSIALAGLRPSIVLITIALFGVMLFAPFVIASSSAIWMTKTPPAVQGRVFAMRKMMAMSTLPFAMFVAGPLAERVFEPMMMPGGALASTAGALIGVGKGRGIALMMVIIGLAVAVVTALMYLVPLIRNLEDILPDALPAHPAGAMPGGPAPAPAGEAAPGEPVPAGQAAGIEIAGVHAPAADDPDGEPMAAPGAAPAGA
jgi:predicted MFS family arabinose efflux permease